MEKIISYDQLVAALLVNYKTELNLDIMVEAMGFCNHLLGPRYKIQDAELTFLEEYIEDTGLMIRMKRAMTDITRVHGDKKYTVKDRLAMIAGNDALALSELFVSHGCLNCTEFLLCDKPSYEKTGRNENGLPIGYNCPSWKNEHYKELVLSRPFRNREPIKN